MYKAWPLGLTNIEYIDDILGGFITENQTVHQ